jgi:hypothetical protein
LALVAEDASILFGFIKFAEVYGMMGKFSLA